jgi:hypothetical protein
MDNFDLTSYSDSDFAGYVIDRKGTSETCQFLRQALVLRSSKKQNSMETSTTKAKYNVVGSICA